MPLAKGADASTTKALRKAEADLWAEEWAKPQAAMWERVHCAREVAQYVRWKVRAEAGDLRAATEARQLGDRLGLTPMAMLRLRWEIPPDELEQLREDKAAVAPKRRLMAVDPNAVAGS